MRTDIGPVAVILGMAALTYFTRAFGFFLADRVTRLPERVERVLKFIPGTIIISIIAPAVFSKGPVNLSASVICLVVAIKSNSMVLTMIAGVLVVAFFRNYGLF